MYEGSYDLLCILTSRNSINFSRFSLSTTELTFSRSRCVSRTVVDDYCEHASEALSTGKETTTMQAMQTPRPHSLAMSTVSNAPSANSTTLALFNSAAPALVQSLVNSRLSASPTLLPQNIASLITALSLAARVSIRASALLIEAMLESARYSTATGMGLTRRALISAVGSARALHYVNQKLDWSGRDANGTKSE